MATIFADSVYNYEELLAQADTAISNQFFDKSLTKLSIARQKVPEPDYRYFNLLGETYYRMERYPESIDSFQKSLFLKKDQPELLLHLLRFFDTERRAKIAFSYGEELLKWTPYDKKLIYRMAVIANRIGRPNDAKKFLDMLEADKRYDLEKKAILEDMEELLRRKSYKRAIEETEKFLLYFPREEFLHESHILAWKGFEETREFQIAKRPDQTIRNFENRIKFPNENKISYFENAMIDAASIFPDKSKFMIRYGLFLMERERYREAIAVLRRAYRFAISKKKDKELTEILYLVRQCYFKMGRNQDSLFVNYIIALFDRTKAQAKLKTLSVEAIPEKEIDFLSQQAKTNWESILLGKLYFQRTNNRERFEEYSELFRNVEEYIDQKDLLRVSGPFSEESGTL